MSLRSFISENKLKFGYKDLHTLLPSNGIYYNTLGDALSDINNISTTKASYIAGNLLQPWEWMPAMSTDAGYTISGVTFKQIDDFIIANGVATSDISFSFLFADDSITSSALRSGIHYKLSGCPSGGSVDTFSLKMYNSSHSESDFGQGAYYTPASDERVGYTISIRSGYAASNLEFKPELNICNQFQGYVFEAFGNRLCRNLADVSTLFNSSGITIDSSGTMTGTASAFKSKIIDLSAYVGSTICVSMNISVSASTSDAQVSYRVNNANTSADYMRTRFISSPADNGSVQMSFTVGSGDRLILEYSKDVILTISQFQIQLGIGLSTYQQYSNIEDNSVSVIYLADDGVRDESDIVSAYPDNLIIDLNGHKLTASTQIGMNNGTAENSMCFYGMKLGSEITSSARIMLYARNKETYIIGGNYVNNSTSSAGIYILYCFGANTTANGGAEYTNSCLYIDSANLTTGPDIVATQSSSKFNYLVAAQKIRLVEILNSSISSVTPSGAIGIYVNSGAARDNLDACSIRNVKMEIRGTFTDDRVIYGAYMYGGTSSTNPLKYEVRDCVIKVTKLNNTADYGYAIYSISNTGHSGDPINEYIVNCECYGTVGGIYTQTPNTYIRNCIVGGGNSGLSAHSSNINVTDSQFKLSYSDIDNTACSTIDGPIVIARSSNAHIDNCKTYIDSHFDNSYNRIYIDPVDQANYNKLYAYLSNTKTDNVYVAANSTCYIGENVSNTLNTGSPIISGGGSIINNSENYAVWSYPQLSYPELIQILSEFRQILAGKGISIPTILDLSHACDADILTLAEYITNQNIDGNGVSY